MAFRRRRGFGRARIGSRRRAGAFAPAISNGRSIAWEGLANVFGAAAAVFPVVTSATVLSRVLLPENVTRGVVTLERVRGAICVDGSDDQFTAAADAFLTMGMQLAPVINGVVPVTAILDPDNAADLESNRWLWRRTYHPVTLYSSAAVQRAPCSLPPPSQIDIRSKRRFNRAAWALLLTISGAGPTQFNVNLDIRGLFRAGDGM